MNDKRATLATFFGITPADAADSETSQEPKEGSPARRIEESLDESLKDRVALVSTAALLTAIGVFLDIPLKEILVNAWNEGELFKKYTDPENFDPEKEVPIVLKTHEVESTHKPRIDVELNGETIHSIEFELMVKLILEGVVVTLRGGQIVDIRSGTIKGGSKLTWEGLILFDLETELMELPGKLAFAEQGAGEQ